MTTNDENQGDKLSGDQKHVATGGGDYAEGNIDKRQGFFVADNIFGDVIAQHIIQQAAALSPALHQLRAPVSDFVGREREVDQLVEALTKAGGTAAAISGVRGMGGIGKTELAYTVANRLKDAFPDAQLLIELGGAGSSPLTPQQALKTAILSFEREAKLPDDLGQLKGVYNSVLAGKRAVILADDAKDAAQIRPLMPPPGCALLVTSRNRFSLPGMVAIDLGMLPPKEAEKLLLEICQRIGSHASELARLCGYLPLALRVSASLLKENDSRDVARYLEQLQVERLKHLKDEDDPDNPDASVEASLRLSYNGLEPDAQEILHQVSVIQRSFGISLAQAVIILECQTDVEALLRQLRRRSFLEWSQEQDRYSIHDIVRAFALSHLTTQEVYVIRSRYIEALLRSPKTIGKPLNPFPVQWHASRYYSSIIKQKFLQGEQISPTRRFVPEFDQIAGRWQWVIEQGPSRPTDELLLDFADLIVFVLSHWDDDHDFRSFCPFVTLLEDALAAAKRLERKSDEKIILKNLTKMREELRKANELHQRLAASQSPPPAENTDEG